MKQPLSKPATSLKKSSLSAPRQRLLDLILEINFGRIENLIIHDGEPLFSPPPQQFLEIKIGAENGPRPERACKDFNLKKQWVQFFDQLSRIKNGTILVIDIQNGLPLRLKVARNYSCP